MSTVVPALRDITPRWTQGQTWKFSQSATSPIFDTRLRDGECDPDLGT